MNIDLKKKSEEFENRMARKSVNYLKDMALDAIDHFVDPSKHGLANKFLSGIVKAGSNAYMEEYNLYPTLDKVESKTQELPATITKIPPPAKAESNEPSSDTPQEPEPPKHQEVKRRV